MTLPLRAGIRAVVLDQDDRILLVHFRFPNSTFWAAPGGGVEFDETPEVAIRRELREEVGLLDVELGPVVWRRTHVFEGMEHYSGQQEKFFLVRVTPNLFEPSFSKEQLLAEGLVGSRWWSVQEINDAVGERFSPARLGPLLEDLLVNGPPEEVIDAGV